jgi:hypothetical protein
MGEFLGMLKKNQVNLYSNYFGPGNDSGESLQQKEFQEDYHNLE